MPVVILATQSITRSEASPTKLIAKSARSEPPTTRQQTKIADHRQRVQHIDNRVVRLTPEIPAVAKIPRQPVYQTRPAETNDPHSPRGENMEWGINRQSSVRWILWLGLGISSLVMLAWLLLPLINRSNAGHTGQLTWVLDQPIMIDDLDPFNRLLTMQDNAIHLFQRFAAAASAAEVLPLVRDAQALAPLIRANHRPLMASNQSIAPDGTTWKVVDNDGTPFGLLEGILPDFSKFSAYCVISNKHLLVDWLASTAYGTATFEELEQNQGNPAEIRGTIIPSDFFTGAFPEDKFQCYQLFSPNKKKSIWCYAHRGESLDESLRQLVAEEKILNLTPQQKKVTLQLDHAPFGALPNQWLVIRMLHKEWLAP